ncbi:MAG: peptidase M64 [Ignavibacteriales bacterium]|nr:peptidase M64 [Ignavibacteriales bacterium]MCB9260241.1 peptidase M64 [Ignavibacteriales bacterium]
MIKKILILFFIVTTCLSAQVKYDDYFYNKQLRLDYFHTGNADSDSYSFDELIEEPYWGGSKINLIDTIGYGNFMFYVYDLKTNNLIYSRGYSSLFQEWQTTEEAKIFDRTFTEILVFPYPKDSIRVEIHNRDSKNKFQKRKEFLIDPNSYFVKKEKLNSAEKFDIHISGESEKKLDIVLLSEGYTKDEMENFEKDCKIFANTLFEYEPFYSLRENINIWGVKAISEDSGVDIPGDSVWKNTALNSTFYTFDSERYLMTMDNKSVRNYASNVPYDQIYILVNTEKYGGGAIFNYYSTAASNNTYSKKIYIHEFGHGLAGLADEYYTSDVAYQNFYPHDVEPWEPNITTLVNFESKWKNLLDPNIKIPTDSEGKDKLDLGVFEGGGYVEKGVYRPTISSLMKGWDIDEFNEVCKLAIEKIIKFYSE